MTLTLEDIKKIITNKEYLELQHKLIHEKINLEEIKEIVQELKNSEYVERLLNTKIAIIGSYTIQNINYPLELELIKHGINAKIKYGQYNQYIQEMLNKTSFLYEFNPEIIILAINTSTFLENIHISLNKSKSEIDQIVESKLNYLYSAINTMNKVMKNKVLITNLEIPSYSPHGIRDVNCEEGIRYIISDFNYKLFIKTKNLGNVFIVDFEKVASHIGKKYITNHKYNYLGKVYLSEQIIPDFCKEIGKIISSIYGKSKKCLVVDLDNTLWGGVIGEDGITGVQIGKDGLGAIYQDIQKIILNYYNNGIILAISSKNNYEDIVPILDTNENMILKKHNFTIIKANWKDKFENIIEISKELNIGLDSMVFLDDNPLERGIIKKKLPTVQVIDFPEDISELPEVLKHLNCFEFLELTEEDKKRNEMYTIENKRIELQKDFDNITDYLFDLNISINIKKNAIKDIDRITQLINKTNQFNVCTNRHTKEAIEEMMNSEKYSVFSMNVWDKFGELGLTGVCIIYEENNCYNITDFLMSCRIMSRGIEKEFLRQCLIKLNKDYPVNAKLIPTTKNEPVKTFYETMNFEIIQKEEKQTIYKFNNKKHIEKVEWIEVKP